MASSEGNGQLVNGENALGPGELYENLGSILITSDQIAKRVRELGAMISEDYAGKVPILVGVLRGVIPFMADLVRSITIPIAVDYICISRYGPSERTHGVVQLIKDLEEPIEGRHVLFVEDIVDTGFTLNYMLNLMRARDPASLKVCTLLDKDNFRLLDLDIAYKGFDLPDQFVVGYGLDYQQLYRNLPFIATLKPEAIPAKH
jgi:hypoxanthine phosphoribosyltransferase